MGRLIEENSVIEVAEKFTFTDKNERRKYLDFVRYCVQNSKTAYDVEKVVAELEEELEEANIMWGNGEFYSGVANGVSYAIDIVKRGGVE